MNSDIVSLIIILICVMLSAYFSATETSFTSLNRIRMKNMAEKGDKRAELVLKLLENFDKLLSTILVWFTTYFGFAEDGFRMLTEDEMDMSILARIGNAIAWIFIPLGWGNWQATVASITGLVAKENIVGTLGILYGGGDLNVYQNIAVAFTGITGYSFLVFNLLCAPCFAAIGAIKREMNNAKWTWFAIGYQCGFAYLIALMINQFGNAFTGSLNVIGLIAAIVVLAGMIYMLFKPYKEATKLSDKH